MFEQLLIADISNRNASVYYELGIRHSLRARRTILVRASQEEVPFDLKTDRLLEYNANDPVSARADLTEAVRQSWIADKADSPMFLLPALEQTPTRNASVPSRLNSGRR